MVVKDPRRDDFPLFRPGRVGVDGAGGGGGGCWGDEDRGDPSELGWEDIAMMVAGLHSNLVRTIP